MDTVIVCGIIAAAGEIGPQDVEKRRRSLGYFKWSLASEPQALYLRVPPAAYLGTPLKPTDAISTVKERQQ